MAILAGSELTDGKMCPAYVAALIVCFLLAADLAHNALVHLTNPPEGLREPMLVRCVSALNLWLHQAVAEQLEECSPRADNRSI
jgi:hypothetical protein